MRDTALEWTGLLEAFEALYERAKTFSDVCAGQRDGRPYEPHKALQAQLAELAPLRQRVRAELHEAQEISEVTEEDLKHSLRNHERKRMMAGEFQPGDIEKLRKWCRLSEQEMADALGLIHPRLWQRLDQEGPLLRTAFAQLLRIAARNPGAFRALVPEVVGVHEP